MEQKLEVDIKEARELARNGSGVVVFSENPYDISFIQEVLCTKNVGFMNMDDARRLIMELDEPKTLENLSRKYGNLIVVCPHGRTSLRFVNALAKFKVTAYSLKRGISGLRYS